MLVDSAMAWDTASDLPDTVSGERTRGEERSCRSRRMVIRGRLTPPAASHLYGDRPPTRERRVRGLTVVI